MIYRMGVVIGLGGGGGAGGVVVLLWWCCVLLCFLSGVLRCTGGQITEDIQHNVVCVVYIPGIKIKTFK